MKYLTDRASRFSGLCMAVFLKPKQKDFMSVMNLISFHLFMNSVYTSFMKVFVTWYFHNKYNMDSVLKLQKVHSDKIPGINLDIILFVFKVPRTT